MNKNKYLLNNFIEYCLANPEQRFWQALRNWSGEHFILAAKKSTDNWIDTFYWEGKNG